MVVFECVRMTNVGRLWSSCQVSLNGWVRDAKRKIARPGREKVNKAGKQDLFRADAKTAQRRPLLKNKHRRSSTEIQKNEKKDDDYQRQQRFRD